MYSSDMYMASDIASATMNSAPMMGLFFGIMIFSIVLGLISIISYWKIFNKAGKPGWASIIPIYNYVVMIQIAKLSMVYLILLIIPIANIFATFKINIEIAKKFGKSTGFGIGMSLIPIIFVPLLAFSDNNYEENIVEQKNNNLNEVQNTSNLVNNNEPTEQNIVEVNSTIPTIEANNAPNIESNVEIGIENPNINTINDVTVNNINNESMNNVNSIENSVGEETPTLNNVNAEPVSINTGIAINPEPILNNQENVSPIEPTVNIEEPIINVNNNTSNAFNSKPIEQPAVENIPNINMTIESIEPSPMNNETETLEEPEITPQVITEIPSTNEEKINVKVCKNCGEQMPNIVSICPKCGTDNE